MRRSDGIPRLAPEIEQGNVEYKLILKNPSPERLHRLVTQLNWRLMEGNGQAYYQLGVADSGELIGLTKDEMEATLETLENMAGELGASVLISREIEVRGRFTSLALESVNGMGGTKDMSGVPSSLTSLSATSTDVTTTDTDTSEMDGADDIDINPTDSPTAAEPAVDDDPNEVIVRSAPVPITPSFLRGHSGKRSTTSKIRERTLKPQDFLPSPTPFDLDNTVEDGHDADDEDPQLSVFELGELKSALPSSPRIKLDPTRPAKSKSNKPPRAQGSKSSKPPKGARAPVDAAPKTPEQIAQRMADKRAKRDKRREERRRALLDPVYDHGALVTQDGGERGIDYDKIVSQDADDDELDGIEHLDSTKTIEEQAMTVSVVTLKRQDTVIPQTASTPDTSAKDSANTTEPRLIVEALVVRKAGFGRGFVDLSQFDEELRHLPSFSLS